MENYIKWVAGILITLVALVYGPELLQQYSDRGCQQIKEKAEAEIRRANGPVPVNVSWRDASWSGKHKVAIFHNLKDITLSVVVIFRNSSFGESKGYELVLSPGETKEIGWKEGWDVLPGETIELSSDNYLKQTWTLRE